MACAPNNIDFKLLVGRYESMYSICLRAWFDVHNKVFFLNLIQVQFLLFSSCQCGEREDPPGGDRVLVEAVYNPNMPFKWNAQRIQTLPQLSNQSVRMPDTASLFRERQLGQNEYNILIYAEYFLMTFQFF